MTDHIVQRLPVTLLLVFTAQILALFIGVILGVISARKPNGLARHFVTILVLYSRLSRATMMEVLGPDYVRTAKAKGLSEREVVYKHVLKNSLSPVITLAGLQFFAVISGAVLVEAVFSWLGLGTLAFQSIIA